MPVLTTLTVGWPQAEANDLTPASLLDKPVPQSGKFLIHNCASIFRRRAGGFTLWKIFAERVNHCSESGYEIECQFDLFAFAFLSDAKNVDLMWPIRHGSPFASPEHAKRLDLFDVELRSLEQFESSGVIPEYVELSQTYLRVRQILSRQSCRDERRTIVALLVNGPSTAVELGKDLGISTNLSERVLTKLHQGDDRPLVIRQIGRIRFA